MNKLVPIGILAVFLAIAAMAIQGRSRPDPRLAQPEPSRAAVAHQGPLTTPSAAPNPSPAPLEEVRAASEQVRIRATYQNYRAAVAVNNVAMQAALLPVLLRDRKSAEAFAEADLARSTDDHDRSVTERTLSALRRNP